MQKNLRPYLHVHLFYNPAGKSFPCVSCRLRPVIVRVLVYYYCSSHNLFGLKPVCIKCQKSIPVIAEQHRHVSRMERMGHIRRIIMSLCRLERIGAISLFTGTPFMDMKTERVHRCRTWGRCNCPWEIIYFSHDQGAVTGSVKFYCPCNVWSKAAPFDLGFGIWLPGKDHICEVIYVPDPHRYHTIMMMLLHNMHQEWTRKLIILYL